MQTFKKNRSISYILPIIVGISTLMQIILRHGWPLNHEGNSFFLRTIIYADHICAGDYWPIWSSMDNYGLGSPQPLFYHKVFYFISGSIYALTNNIKLSVVISILLFLVIGFYGMYSFCKESGCRKELAYMGGLILIVSNYTITDWLIRGAMAEFSACMFIPLSLALYLRVINKNSFKDACLFGVIITILFFSHSVIAFYFILFLSIVTLALLIKNKEIKIIILLTCSAFIFFLLTWPHFLALISFSDNYDLSRIIPYEYRPENRFIPLRNYFWDNNWIWGKEWASYTVQLDIPVLILFVLMVLFIFLNKNTRNISLLSNSIIMCCLIIFLCFLLQCKASSLFYEMFPGAVYLQFPWRLLGILSPCIIGLSLLLCQNLLPKFALFISFIIMCFCFIMSGAYKHIEYEWMSNISNELNNVSFSAFGEYLPKDFNKNSKNDIIEFLEKEDCQLIVSCPSNIERDSCFIQYEITTACKNFYPLPILFSPYHKITIYKDNQFLTSACVQIDKYPGICSVFLEAGKSELLVEFPTIKSIVFPTPVGVFPAQTVLEQPVFRLPHARGGVSKRGTVLVAHLPSSPRPWGCFRWRE